jgi:antitoxin component YwqK of YwqJK toxin-antitoxin module
LFSDSVYGEEPGVKKEYWDSGKLKKEPHWKNGLRTEWSEENI